MEIDADTNTTSNAIFFNVVVTIYKEVNEDYFDSDNLINKLIVTLTYLISNLLLLI